MEGLDAATTKALWWLVRLNRKGYRPTEGELTGLTRGRHQGKLAVLSALDNTSFFRVTGAETPGEAVFRLGLAIRWDDEGLEATALGIAAAGVLDDEQGREDDEAAENTPVIIRPGDPTALPILLERFQGATEGLLVDPYLTADTLVAAARSTRLNRYLVNPPDAERRHLLAMVVVGLTDAGRSVEVRESPEIHDRHVLTPDEVWTLGGSLNGTGRQKVNVLMQVQDSADVIRRAYEEMWATATPVTGEQVTPGGSRPGA